MSVYEARIDGTTVRCGCGCPVAYLAGRDLIIQARHHGEKHRVVIPLDKLLHHKVEVVTVTR